MNVLENSTHNNTIIVCTYIWQNNILCENMVIFLDDTYINVIQREYSILYF